MNPKSCLIIFLLIMIHVLLSIQVVSGSSFASIPSHDFPYKLSKRLKIGKSPPPPPKGNNPPHNGNDPSYAPNPPPISRRLPTA